jgi:hypothetical protein
MHKVKKRFDQWKLQTFSYFDNVKIIAQTRTIKERESYSVSSYETEGTGNNNLNIVTGK